MEIRHMSLKKRLQKTVDFYLWCIFFKMTKKEREREHIKLNLLRKENYLKYEITFVIVFVKT